MTRSNRTLATLTILSLLTPGLGRLGHAQAIEVNPPRFTLSGTVGVAGVTLRGLPAHVVSDDNGVYSVRVPYGWSGTVVPAKPGYGFEPATKEYRAVKADLTAQNYTARILTYVISGNVGRPGVAMKGLPGEPVSDENGAYSATVEYGWSGTVKPEKRGFVFSPVSKSYPPVTQDRRNDDYSPSIVTFAISGKTGVGGVTMKGLPGDPVTDREGSYEVTVDYGWTGKVTPAKEGYAFEPEWRAHAPVTQAMTHEDYTVRVLTYEISGSVGLPDVVMKGLPDDPVSDAQGNYVATVPHGWSGKVTPEREGVRFEPATRMYQRVGADSPGGDYVPSLRNLPPFAVGAAEILVIPTWEVDPEDFAETREDMQVMLQILREKLSEPRMILGVLRDYGDFFRGAGRNIEAFYLQGQAAVFVLRVDFPLSFPSAPPAEGQRESQPAVDPVWQRARERLYAPPAAPGYGSRRRSSETSEMSFEQFKEDLLKTLRHAANLRHVEPNESVILTIIGQGDEGLPSGFYGGGMMGGGVGGYGGGTASGYSSGGGSFSGGAGGFGGGGAFYTGSRASSGVSGGSGTGIARRAAAAPGSATVLTIQAQKADIDAFAKGTLDLEQFRQRVKTFTY